MFFIIIFSIYTIFEKIPCLIEEGCGFYGGSEGIDNCFLYPALDIKFYNIEKNEIFFASIKEFCGNFSEYICGKREESYFSCDKLENPILYDYKSYRKIIPKNLERIKKSFPNAKEFIEENGESIEILYDGKNFIYIYAPERYYFSFEDYKKEEEFSFIWGNEGKIFYQKLKWSSPIEDLIFNEGIDLDYVAERNKYYSYCYDFVVDEKAMDVDKDGFWIGVSFYDGEGCLGRGGIIFLSLNEEKIEIFSPFWMANVSVKAISPLSDGKAIFSLYNKWEGPENYPFPSPLIIDRKERKIIFWNFFNNLYENFNDFIYKNGKIYIASNLAIYELILEKDKKIKKNIFIPNLNFSLLKVFNGLEFKSKLSSKDCMEWKWALQYGTKYSSSMEVQDALKIAWLNLKEEKCKFNSSSGLMNSYDLYKHILLSGLAKTGNHKFLKEILPKIIKELKEKKTLSYESAFASIFYYINDDDLKSNLCKEMINIHKPFMDYYMQGSMDKLMEAFLRKNGDMQNCIYKILMDDYFKNEAIKVLSMERNPLIVNFLKEEISKKKEISIEEIGAIGRLKIKAAQGILEKIVFNEDESLKKRCEALKSLWEINSLNLLKNKENFLKKLNNDYLVAGFKALERSTEIALEIFEKKDEIPFEIK